MVRAVNKLSVLRIKGLKKPGRYSDGDGLYLYVSKTGNRSWVFRYRDRVSGRLRDKGLGPARDVSLEHAREAAHAARAELRAGVDPIDTRHAQRNEAQRERAQRITFGKCAERYIEAHKAAWRNAKHGAQWSTTLETYAARLKSLPVGAVDTAAVLDVLEPIWATKTETATRVRQRIEAVLDWATARKYRHGENPARWRGHLGSLLPTPNKLKKVNPRAALAYADLPEFFAELSEENGLAPIALQLQILTATRPGEVVGARWCEIDLKLETWTIPGERMKAGKDHRVPLSAQAAKLLQSIPQEDGFVFPGLRGNCMTTAAPLKVLKGLRPGLTSHGFRSTFRDWAADMTSYPREVAEEALAHGLKDKTEAAYRRTDLFTKRTNLMADWAAYCASPTESNDVSRIENARARRRAG